MDVDVRPCPLGKVVVTTPGTPVQLTTATEIAAIVARTGKPAYGNANNMDDAWARRIDFVAPTPSPGGTNTVQNQGRIYVGLKTMNKTTLVGVMFYLDPGQTFTFDNPQQPLAYHLGDYWVDAETANDYLTGDFDPS